MRKTPVPVLLLALALSACATVPGPKHYESLGNGAVKSAAEIPALPSHLVGRLVIHTPDGTLQAPSTPIPSARAAIEAAPAYQPPAQPPFYQRPPSPAQPSYQPPAAKLPANPLSAETREYLDRQIASHQQRHLSIVGIEARWPDHDLPPDHLAYSVQNYLQARGINVGIVPSYKQSASKTDAGLLLRR